MLQKQIGEKTEGVTTCAKRITFTHEGKDYKLEFTRDSVKTMERQGFDANEVVKRPVAMLPEVFAGAFIANHPFTRRKIIDRIFSEIDEKAELLDALAGMLNGVYEEILAELEATNKGFKWKRE